MTAIGALVIRLVRDLGAAVLLLARASALLAAGRVDGREALRHAHRFLLGSLLLVLSGSVVVGGVVAMQGLGFTTRYSATDVFGWAAGLSSFRDVGPLLLGFTLAARLGTRNAAELATLAARERLDALTALGLDVTATVTAPRLWAITAVTIVFYPLASVTVLASSFIVAWAVGDQPLAISWSSFTTYLSAKIVLQGLVRQGMFGLLIALASCLYGMLPAGPSAPRDARAIGRAVFASSVACMSGIVVINLWLSLIGGTS